MTRTLAALLAIALAAASADGADRLRYEAPPGTRRAYVTKLTRTTKATVTDEDGEMLVLDYTSSQSLPFRLVGLTPASDGSARARIEFITWDVHTTVTGPDAAYSAGSNPLGTRIEIGPKQLDAVGWVSAATRTMVKLPRLTRTPLVVRISPRGQLLESNRLDALVTDLEGLDVPLVTNRHFVLPEGAASPGDTWQVTKQQLVADPTRPGTLVPCIGTARYEYVERVMHRDTWCAKIALDATYTPTHAPSSTFEQTVIGQALVAVKTGVIMESRITAIQTIRHTDAGRSIVADASATLVTRYLGRSYAPPDPEPLDEVIASGQHPFAAEFTREHGPLPILRLRYDLMHYTDGWMPVTGPEPRPPQDKEIAFWVGEVDHLLGATGGSAGASPEPDAGTEATQLEDAEPDPVEALRALRVPMMTGHAIKIGPRLYGKGDVVSVGGDNYRIIAFKSTALKLQRQSDSAVYQLGVNSQGRITYVKLRGYAN